MYFAEAFPDTELLVCTAETSGIGRDSWADSGLGVLCVMGEVERCGAQFAQEFAKEAAVTEHV